MINNITVKPMTPADAKAEFRAQGMSIRAWAVGHGYSTSLVYGLLSGRIVGLRGRAHEVAIALGLKPAPSKIAVYEREVAARRAQP